MIAIPIRARAALLLLGLLAASASARAETYRVDLIVFVDQSGAGGEAGAPIGAPDYKNALSTDDASGLRAAGIEVLPDAQFGLTSEWSRLRGSRFKPLLRLAWTQKDPPQERGPALRVRITAADGNTPLVEGSVALLLSHYLHLDAALQYESDGQVWKLTERRRMRRDEIHHLDSARLGILARVTKAGGGADSTP